MTNPFFPELSGRFGFGLMRLPMCGEDVDIEQTTKMTDLLLDAGFTYFDTAHDYISGKSEPAARAALTSRYPRDRYIFTNKLSGGFFHSREEILPLFESQLEACGLEYFDFYLMHALGRENLMHFEDCGAFETAFRLKEEGRVRHVGFSFHDTADVLDGILTKYPAFEVVQLQLNYLDWDDPRVQSRACCEVCKKHGKPVIVMEPVKGGSLSQMIPAATGVLDALREKRSDGCSNAAYALRFVLGLENVCMVISGMSELSQMEDNLSAAKDFRPLDEEEAQALADVVAAFNAVELIGCTKCRYCTDGCPMGINIPEIFELYNRKTKFLAGWTDRRYQKLTENGGKASSCIGCGRCESVCPQHLEIPALLERAAGLFE